VRIRSPGLLVFCAELGLSVQQDKKPTNRALVFGDAATTSRGVPAGLEDDVDVANLDLADLGGEEFDLTK
jgi:hypothetical protein